MTEYFFRDGTPASVPADAEVRNGSATFVAVVDCPRCCGTGHYSYCQMYGTTCFQCAGAKKVRAKVKAYTAAKLAQLNKAAERRDAQKAAARQAAETAQAEKEAAFYARHSALLARMEQYAERSRFINSVRVSAREWCNLTDNQIIKVTEAMDKMDVQQQQNARSNWVGTLGQRLDTDVVLDKHHEYEGHDVFGRPQTQHVYTFRDDAGNLLVWKTAKRLSQPIAIQVGEQSYPDSRFIETGERLHLRGTVAHHTSFRDAKQTELKRCTIKVLETA